MMKRALISERKMYQKVKFTNICNLLLTKKKWPPKDLTLFFFAHFNKSRTFLLIHSTLNKSQKVIPNCIALPMA